MKIFYFRIFEALVKSNFKVNEQNQYKPRIDAIFKTLPKLNFKDKEQNQSKPIIEAILKHLQNLISRKKAKPIQLSKRKKEGVKIQARDRDNL